MCSIARPTGPPSPTRVPRPSPTQSEMPTWASRFPADSRRPAHWDRIHGPRVSRVSGRHRALRCGEILHRELSHNHELVARFHREAKVASRLVHPNVVQVLMTGALPMTPDPRRGGELYLVMEYLDGISSFRPSWSPAPPMNSRRSHCRVRYISPCRYAMPWARPTPRASSIGISSPRTSMLVRRGDDPDYVKVLDFGIARLDWAERAGGPRRG